MSAGSIIGVTLGGFRGLPMRRLGFRKTFLGCVLIAAAGKTIAGHSGKP